MGTQQPTDRRPSGSAADSTQLEFAPVVREWSMDYAMVHGCVPLARHHVQRELMTWQWAGAQHDATVIVSELVTNAINHARVLGHTVFLRLALLKDDSLLIEVTDPVRSFQNFGDSTEASPQKERGRGLCVVRALGGALSWFPHDTRGKTVRAHLKS